MVRLKYYTGAIEAIICPACPDAKVAHNECAPVGDLGQFESAICNVVLIPVRRVVPDCAV